MTQYFSQFPLTNYNLSGVNGNTIEVTDIFRRVKARSKIADNVTLFDNYDVHEGEKPEDVAYKIYGESDYFWVVTLVNNIVNRYYDWPLPEFAFQQYLKDKYSNPDAVHHYEISQESGDTDVKINIGTSNADYPTATLITNYEYEQKLQDDKRKIRLLDPSFISQFVTEYKSLMSESNI